MKAVAARQSAARRSPATTIGDVGSAGARQLLSWA